MSAASQGMIQPLTSMKRLGLANSKMFAQLRPRSDMVILARFSRTAAAAAKGESSTATNEKAARSGKAPFASPSRLARIAPAPKITAGEISGRMSSGKMRPPRRTDSVSPAPMAPMALMAGVPSASEAMSAS